MPCDNGPVVVSYLEHDFKVVFEYLGDSPNRSVNKDTFIKLETSADNQGWPTARVAASVGKVLKRAFDHKTVHHKATRTWMSPRQVLPRSYHSAGISSKLSPHLCGTTPSPFRMYRIKIP